jgi:hypothetical protein
MAVSASQLRHAELSRLIEPQISSLPVKQGLEALVDMMSERMRPTGGRARTLSPRDVDELQGAAREKGSEVESAFKELLKEALEGTIVVGNQSVPLLLLDDAAREQLATFAGYSAVTQQPVRAGLDAHAGGDERKTKQSTDNMLAIEGLRMQGLTGLARGRKEQVSELGLVGAGIRELSRVSGDSSVAAETLEALGPRINQAVTSVGMSLWKDEKVRTALGKIVADPTTAKGLLPSLCRDAGGAISSALGCKLVNEEVVSKLGGLFLKEGAEQVAKEGAKQGVKKGVMGLLSSIPLANVIPMLFTGAEMLGEFTKSPPDKRKLGKGLATFALQIGAIAFPPLGLAATAVDLTGSVALAVADGQKAGLSKEDRRARAQGEIDRNDERTMDMAAAIDSNAGLVSQSLHAMERSFRELGSHDRADLAKALSERAEELRKDPKDEQAARRLHHDLGKFSFESLLPEMIDQVKKLRENYAGDRNQWSLMAEGLSQVRASVLRVYEDPQRNEPFLKTLISGILKAGIAGKALAQEPA